MPSLPDCVRDFHALLTRDANARLALGVDERLGELPDPSLEAAQARVQDARALRRRFAEIDTTSLDFDSQLDIDLACLRLDEVAHTGSLSYNGRPHLAQLPSAGDDIGDGLFLLFISDPRPDAERLVDITARLEAAPRYLEALLERLDTPVERWVQMDLQKVEGLPQLFSNLQDWAEEQGWADAPRLARACREASEALEGYAASLKAMPTTPHFALAEEDARELLRLRGIPLSFEELQPIARDYLAETRAIIHTLHGKLVDKYELPSDTTVEGLQQHLAKRFRVSLPSDTLEDVLVRYQQERRKILGFIRERDLFPVFEEQDMLILRTPSFMEPSIPAGAMMPPPPFREGTRTSLVYLTLSEELLDEHTELSIPAMMIHEGIPGHHLQLATASIHSSVVRRHYEAMEHAEGWTTMLEDYMLDVGYLGDLTDEARFIGKRDICRIGARVAIDLYFMTGNPDYLEVGVDYDRSSDDPFVRAGSLLGNVTGFVPGRVQAELNWYSQAHGVPLSYLTGNHMVWKLKRDLQAANPEVSSIEIDRTFHRIYLQSSNMPVKFLRKVFAHEGMLPKG